MSMTTDIKRYKQQLLKRYQKSGIYEDFGQNEVRKLWDKYGDDFTYMQKSQPIRDFDSWCMNYTGHD